ncbi:MAG: ATP-binding protein [Paludibacteraceae bacterium]|nr:ATP-binding protein [Paludibacteraceae bacterium]
MQNQQVIIDKRVLETILLDQKAEVEQWSNDKFCPRGEKDLIDLDSPQAQVVIGVRRSGKSTLCKQTLVSANFKFAYADFDDERMKGLGTNQLNDVLETLYKIYGDFRYIFLDEIQNIDGWPLFVNRLLRNNIHVILTGSNAKLLSTDLATHLTGRSSEIELYPFSFREYCTINSIDYTLHTTKGIADLRRLFDKYMAKGGFPELTIIKDEKRYISNLVDNILKRDIEQRYNITFTAQFENLANHLLNISPTVVSAQDLADVFNFKSAQTVRNYISYLKQAYLLIGVKKFSTKSKIRITQEKLYAVDVALMNQRDNAFASENMGWRLETIVLIQLMRKCKSEGLDVYYLKNRSGECDFILCDGNKVIQCIQVSYDISSEKTRKREIKGLMLAHKQTHCKNLLLLTDHEYGELEADGVEITIQPVYDYII